MLKNLVKEIIKNGGRIKPIILPNEMCKGTGQTNPSLFIDDKIRMNLRNVQYVLVHSENNQVFESKWGPLAYLHPENDLTLRTTNFYLELDDDLNIVRSEQVNTTKLDVPPVWEFIGLEDARIVFWEDKYWLFGVRRDTKPNGEGRMELSELAIRQDGVFEVNRYRIEPPAYTYCEKNWMPINDMPFHAVKWSNPAEIVKLDIQQLKAEQVHLSRITYPLPRDIRGSSNVFPYKKHRIALTHEVDLFKNEIGRKDAQYYHRFLVWDENWNIVKTSVDFKFLSAWIEFSCACGIKDDKMLMAFGFQDNESYIVEAPMSFMEKFIYG